MKSIFTDSYLLTQNNSIDIKTISVIGLGYIGLPTSVAFSVAGFNVTGIDTNAYVVNELRSGRLHIEEAGLEDFYQLALSKKKFAVEQNAVAADVHIICVPTPVKPDKSADLTYVESAAEAIAKVIQPGNLVILESTVPPRCCEDVVAPIIQRIAGLEHGKDYGLVHCPERVIPGRVLQELVENDRIIGGTTLEAALEAKVLYESFVKGHIHVTSATTAELVKLMENTFRDVNIALANELKMVCHRLGVDVTEAIALANRHPRVNIHQPGIGVGGHCIPVDPWFIAEIAPEITPLIQTARKINDGMPRYTALEIIAELAGQGKTLASATVGVLGLTYKPNVDDFRESPAIEVVHELLERGVRVLVHDPYLHDRVRLPEGAVVSSLEDIRAADVVRVLVEHGQYR
jgi:UDP-N-acetyl-D-mannosaminuronic acid dehydrogenase